MPPVGEIIEKTDEDSRSNRRPIELIDSPAASDPRSQTAEPQNNRCELAASYPHSTFAKRLECCSDRLNPPPTADVLSVRKIKSPRLCRVSRQQVKSVFRN